MQRRALQLQAHAGEVAAAPDPVDEQPELLATLAIPALVTAGELDMVDFRDGAEALARTLPRARHETIAGAGHLAPLERPAEFRALLLAFLAAA
jgi:3-oxoadipate enol-lactonase